MWGGGYDRVPEGHREQTLKIEFIALLDIQKQAFGSDIQIVFHTWDKGRAKLQHGMIYRDVLGQLLLSFLKVLLVIACN